MIVNRSPVNRRRLLATLGAASVAGLAGCQGSVSDTGESCSEPSTDDLQSLLPEGDSNFEQRAGDPPSAPNAQSSVGQMYQGELGRYGFIVAKYESESAAQDDTGNLFSGRDNVGTVGYVVVGPYTFAANAWPGGGGESEVRNLLAASSALNQVCVTANAGFQ